MDKLDAVTIEKVIEDLKEMRDNGILTISVPDLIRLMEFKYKKDEDIESQESSINDDRAFL